MTDDITNIEAARARLRALREQRLAERIEAGAVALVDLCIVAGSETEARAQVEQAKADKLAELRAAGETREIVFDVTMVVTGVVRPGETADPAAVPSAPTFALREDIGPPLPSPMPPAAPEEEAQPQLIETYVCVQVGRCRDDDDPGEVVEGYFSVDGSTVTVTDSKGREIGSRAMLEGEDARVVAKRLLREKTPEDESFNRPLSYPNAGLA